MNLKPTTLWFLATGLLLSACFTKDSGDTGSTSSDAGTATGDAGTTTGDAGTATGDAGTTTGDAGTTTGDAGTTTGDAGTTTGDAGTTTGDAGTTTTDTGIALLYWNGSAHVVPDKRYTGYEDIYTEVYPSGDAFCTVEYPVRGTPDGTCRDCDWAFDIVGTGGGTDDGSMGCPWLISAFGASSASDLGDGWAFNYGYASDYSGYETMFYYYAKYGWYSIYYATASYDGSTFDYSWYSGGFYFYWGDL